MKQINFLLIFFLLFFCSCEKNDYLGNDQNNEKYHSSLQGKDVYIYEETLSNVSLDKCYIIGTINGKEVNRGSNIKNGFVKIGTDRLYENECQIEMTVLIKDKKIAFIKGKKKVQYLEEK